MERQEYQVTEANAPTTCVPSIIRNKTRVLEYSISGHRKVSGDTLSLEYYPYADLPQPTMIDLSCRQMPPSTKTPKTEPKLRKRIARRKTLREPCHRDNNNDPEVAASVIGVGRHGLSLSQPAACPESIAFRNPESPENAVHAERYYTEPSWRRASTASRSCASEVPANAEKSMLSV